MADCIFCKIVNKEIPKEFVFENEKFVAFEDINPKAPVHILAVLKGHVASVREADDKLIAELVQIAKKIAAERGLEGYFLARGFLGALTPFALVRSRRFLNFSMRPPVSRFFSCPV